MESEKIKIKYTCVGNGNFVLTHTWEFSLFSWDCNLSLIFCNASFSSLSLSLSDLSFLKSSSYICTCNHYDQVCEFQQSHNGNFHPLCCLVAFKHWPSSRVHSKGIPPLHNPATKSFPHLFYDQYKMTSKGCSPMAPISRNSPQLQYLWTLAI